MAAPSGDYARLPDVAVCDLGGLKRSCSLARCVGQRRLLLVQEVFPPFLLAGLGMVAAGLLLGWVHRWQVFRELSAMLILVPALLGLKGNLEMTLAARLSTHANLGHLDDAERMLPIVVGNVAVVQCQAIVVGFLAALAAVVLDLLTTGQWQGASLALVSCCSVTAASTASLLLAGTMIAIVLLARRQGVNPDNVASPIAGMLGDFCTLGLLAAFAHGYWSTREELWWLPFLMNGLFLAVALLSAKIALRSAHTADVLREGWAPVIVSMLISSIAGAVLKHSVLHFSELAAFAPVTNGAGGNLAAVQASRLSTDLHAHGRPGDEEELTPKGTCTALLGSRNEHASAARTLVALSLPGALCFAFLIVEVRSKGTALPDPLFLALYLCAVAVQVCTLFVAAHGIVNVLWRGGINPDNAAIPYVTSLGDLVGTTCLTAAFFLLYALDGAPWEAATQIL